MARGGEAAAVGNGTEAMTHILILIISALLFNIGLTLLVAQAIGRMGQ